MPRAHVLIIESTYGHPRYRRPVRQEAVGQLVEQVRKALEAAAVPVVEAYRLRKAQEVTRLLRDEGLPVFAAQRRVPGQPGL